MKLIVSCLISLTLLFNMSFANIMLPNANNLFTNSDEGVDFIDTMDTSMGPGLNAILLLLYKVGCAIAVIATGVIAIKLLLAGPAQKAEIKAAILPYLIGLLLLIAGVRIAIKVIEAYTILF